MSLKFEILCFFKVRLFSDLFEESDRVDLQTSHAGLSLV